ncbi:hypothetical protein [Thermocoleostomius sinensis]|jgi:hypothetical protein|uniref:Uncharacterized protein n=1 Tax=Thermocoleostomius sinensis A174 TaxID=2016057 RepID=A0A9E8ZFJ7_9CYAN|nr:hypothetical protein [Thermocoleostomius sinensis]WAL60300.1 hypothetical protein OXH18_24570 [Thermocoleostomius sinensis A174]
MFRSIPIYDLEICSMLVLENVWAALLAVAAIFIGYYALVYFIVVVMMKQGVPQQRQPRY